MEDRNKMYQNYAHQIEQSVKVARWGAPVGTNQEQTHSFFTNYAANNQRLNAFNQYQSNQQRNYIENQYHRNEPALNELRGMQNGFKKFKSTQAFTLKQLKQQYEILKNLQIDDRIPLPQKIPDSENSSVRDDRSQISSKQSRKRQTSRQAQLLALQKKQLEIVIGNSMKKIQQLLHNEMQYKKQIHELKLQLDNRSAEDKYQHTIRQMKKNQAEAQDNIQHLKKQIERIKGIVKQQSQNIGKLESQITIKNQQLRKCGDEKRKFDDMVKFEKDKYSNLQIQMRKIRMQAEIMEKDKNNQINRLLKQIDIKQASFNKQMNSKMKRMEDQLFTKDRRYQLLLDQFQQAKKSDKNQAKSEHDIKKLVLQAIEQNMGQESGQNRDFSYKIQDLKQQNQFLKSQLSNFNNKFAQFMNSIVIKMENNSEDKSVMSEINRIRNQLDHLKETSNVSDRLHQQQLVIQNLERILQDQNAQKARFQQQLESIRNEYSINKSKLRQYSEKQNNYRLEIKALQNDIILLKGAKNDLSKSQTELVNLHVRLNHMEKCQLQNENLKKQLKQLRTSVEQSQRAMRNSKGIITQYERIQNELNRQRQDKNKVMIEFNKLQSSWNLDISQRTKQVIQLKNQNLRLKRLVDGLGEKQNLDIEENQKMLNGALQQQKLYYEEAVRSLKQRHQYQLQVILNKLQELTQANQKFMIQCEKYSQLQRQTIELRRILKHTRIINDSVDHLWQIKQTQYQNLNEVLRLLKTN